MGLLAVAAIGLSHAGILTSGARFNAPAPAPVLAFSVPAPKPESQLLDKQVDAPVDVPSVVTQAPPVEASKLATAVKAPVQRIQANSKQPVKKVSLPPPVAESSVSGSVGGAEEHAGTQD